MKDKRWWIGALVLAALLILVSGVQLAAGQSDMRADTRKLEFEVAEDGTRFAVDETPVHEDGLPAYGAEFVTQGYIYPAGTLSCEEGACNGVLPDGSPEFPDKVIGTWTCWGYFIGDGALTQTGPVVVTTQLYDLGEMPGEQTLVTDGYELMDLNLPFLRAITGGTGIYRRASGEQTQTLLGFNASNGVSLGVKLEVKK